MPSTTLGVHRLRRGRVSEFGRAYLLTSVTRNREPYFRDWRAGRLLVAQLRAAHDEGWVSSLAWVVMPDHLHWLVHLERCPLDLLMRRVKANSARQANRLLGLGGSFWQDGYHDRALRSDEDLLAVARYRRQPAAGRAGAAAGGLSVVGCGVALRA